MRTVPLWPRLLAFLLLWTMPSIAVASGRHKLTIDDVLDTVALERVTPSPDGEWVAAVVGRPARPGEAFGRNAYEVDPSRDDVWLVSRRTGERRNLTGGAASAAGYWCATWSPDGQRLAMLSTAPERGEPRGGDNVRLYLWTREGGVRRLGDRAVMTQGRYGSGLYPLDLRGGADGGTIAHSCHDGGDENAGFAWLDNEHLLALVLPEGEVSALIDQYRRPLAESARTRSALLAGVEPTATAVGSGAERMARDERRLHATLTVIDARTGAATRLADVPTYPFGGVLTVSISPDRRRAAILAPVRAIAPERGVSLPHHETDWHVEKRLGFIDLHAGAPVHWATLPREARYPLELLAWSPDNRTVALRARAAPAEKVAALFLASGEMARVERLGAPLTVGGESAGESAHEPSAFWLDDHRLLVNGRENGARDDWWLVGRGVAPVNLTAGSTELPATFRRRADGRLVGIAGTRLVALDAGSGRLVPFGATALPAGAAMVWPDDPNRPADALLITSPSGSTVALDQIDLTDGHRLARVALPSSINIYALDRSALVWSEQTATGLFLRETRLGDGAGRDLLARDTHLASVDWGETRIIDYHDTGGHPLKAAVILPPGYQPGRRYPVLTWVYGGYKAHGPDDYWLDRYLPGVYNLQLYAAHGYVVLIPSIPLTRAPAKVDDYAELPGGVLPAIDRLAALRIADPARVAVMGQSFGGYSVYAQVTETNRFRAAIALAGITDLAQSSMQFDPTARGYPGIEHEKSILWSIYENLYGYAVPPYQDPDLYRRNSPIAHVDRVETPLLLIHGELDVRDPLAQAETFFDALYRQGKTARLLRYWGESHSLANSPANVRDIVRETLAWLDRYVGPASASAAGRSRSSPSGASVSAAPPQATSSRLESSAPHRR